MARHNAPAGSRTWILPRSITTAPSGRVVVNSTVSSPSCRHMEMVSASPGSTGLLNRPYMERNLAGSEPHSSCSRARPVTP